MAYFPLALLAVVSTLGLLARFVLREKLTILFRPQFAAIGGYALGLLVCWGLLSVVRSVYLLPMANKFEFYNVVFSPYHLFGIELWLLSAYAINECFHLGGSYSATTEWRSSLIDGCKAVALPIAISTLIFFPTWWMMQPGKYGKFRGSFVGGLVSSSASATFSTSPSTSDLEKLAKLQARAAIPHAIVIATGLTILLMVVKKGVKYMLGTLGETYLHLPPKSTSSTNSTRWPFNPRGGGAN